MKECFCFLFGLICGIGAVYFIVSYIMRDPKGLLSMLRSIHSVRPDIYHLACQLDESDSIKLKEIQNDAAR